jgi:hypothetical protein
MKIRLLALALLVSLSACALGRQGTTGRGNAHGPIRTEELRFLGTGDALSAVRSLRPSWLRSATPQSVRGNDHMVVYFEDLRIGGVDALQGMSITEIGRIEYLRPHQAQFRFGPGHLNGAIVVLPMIHSAR